MNVIPAAEDDRCARKIMLNFDRFVRTAAGQQRVQAAASGQG
jgi:hypothetical protein